MSRSLRVSKCTFVLDATGGCVIAWMIESVSDVRSDNAVWLRRVPSTDWAGEVSEVDDNPDNDGADDGYAILEPASDDAADTAPGDAGAGTVGAGTASGTTTSEGPSPSSQGSDDDPEPSSSVVGTASDIAVCSI